MMQTSASTFYALKKPFLEAWRDKSQLRFVPSPWAQQRFYR